MAIPCKIDPAGTSLLPAGYLRLEAISCSGNSQSNKTHILRAGGTFNKTSVLIADYIPYTTSIDTGWLGSTVDPVTKNRVGFHFSISGATRFFVRALSGGEYVYVSKSLLNNKLHVELDAAARTLTVNEDVYHLVNPLTTVGYDATGLNLFARNDGNGYGDAAIFRAKLYTDGKLIRDLVPAQNLTTGVNGMFDLAGRKFYTNTFTANFIPHYRGQIVSPPSV